jgi:hypothetical protein
MYVNGSEGTVRRGSETGKKNAAALGCIVNLEARAGVEPTYTDLQSGA